MLLFLNGLDFKIGLWARKVSGHFEKQAPAGSSTCKRKQMLYANLTVILHRYLKAILQKRRKTSLPLEKQSYIAYSRHVQAKKTKEKKVISVESS